MKKKLLVTGGNGFIGSHYVDLVKDKYNITVYDLPENDILEYEKLCLYISRCDIVVHFAAIADLYETAKDYEKNFNVNVTATTCIGRLCQRMNKKLIYISTCCAYGNSMDKVEKEFYTNPMTDEPYACSKVAAEYMLRGIHDLKYAILRIGTAYGPRQRETLFTYRAIDYIKKGKTITVHGDGKQDRNLIYIADLVEGIKLATDKISSIQGEIINLCGKERISALDTISHAERVTGKKAKIKHGKDRQGQIRHENISIKKAKEFLGWEPKVSFKKGMDLSHKNDERFN
jgi:nucleoside-diphosphate-sugar epimerase